MAFFANSNIRVSYGSVSVHKFISLWVVFFCCFACLVIFDWMADIVNFTLLDVENIFPIIICEFFPGMQHLGNCSILLCLAFKICYEEPEQCPWILRFPAGLLRTGTISGPVWVLGTVTSNPFGDSFPSLG